MKAAGVDIDQVIENVLAKKCDVLAGWWALLIEKEERKERRRQKKKIESRRMSAASQLDSMPPPVEEVDEDASPKRSNGKNTEKNRMYSCVSYLVGMEAHLANSYNNLARAFLSQVQPTENPNFSERRAPTSGRKGPRLWALPQTTAVGASSAVFSGSQERCSGTQEPDHPKAGTHDAIGQYQALVPGFGEAGDLTER